MTIELIADPANLSSMTVEQLAIQVALRKGLTIRDTLNEISWPPLEGVRPSWIRHCRVDEFLDADRVLSLLDELDISFYEIDWFKTLVGFRLRCYCNGTPYNAKVDTRTTVSRKLSIVLAWIEAFDKGLLKGEKDA